MQKLSQRSSHCKHARGASTGPHERPLQGQGRKGVHAGRHRLREDLGTPMSSPAWKGALFRGSLMPSLTGASQTAAIDRSTTKTTEVNAAEQAKFGSSKQSQGGLTGG